MTEDIPHLLECLAREPSANKRLSLLFRLNSIATPREFAALSHPAPNADAPWQAVPEWRPWVNNTGLYVRTAGKKRAEQFVTTHLSPWIVLYSDEGVPRASKTLVVGITGSLDRFMMPLPALLQCFDARSTDLLVARSSIFKGQNGSQPPSFTNFADAVKTQVAGLGNYRSIVVLGTSLGGLPAVIMGTMLGAEHVVAAGPGSPYYAWWQDFVDFDPHEYLLACDYRPTATLIVSEDCVPDVAHAREISDLVPCETCCLVPGTHKIGHDSLAALASFGDLRPFLEERLFGRELAAPRAWKINRRWLHPLLRYRVAARTG